MCYSLPARVIALGATEFDPVEIDVAGERRTCFRLFVPELALGDWCIVQNGHAVRRLTEEEALGAIAAFRELLGA
ncbi:MAG TPA: HypC/HybG/HupF family hydrogenase formation chaperone [Archangium sp.]